MNFLKKGFPWFFFHMHCLWIMTLVFLSHTMFMNEYSKEYVSSRKYSITAATTSQNLFAGRPAVTAPRMKFPRVVLSAPRKPSTYTERISEELQILLGPGRWVLSAPGLKRCAVPGLETSPALLCIWPSRMTDSLLCFCFRRGGKEETRGPALQHQTFPVTPALWVREVWSGSPMTEVRPEEIHSACSPLQGLIN